MLKTVMTALLLLSAPACVHAQAGADKSTGCGRSQETNGAVKASSIAVLSGRVVDDADLLPPDAEQALTAKLGLIEEATTDQLVVVTLPSLGGKPIETVGLELGNGWGIGQKQKDNGVLLIVAPGERTVRIEVGCGLEGLLTDERAAEIVEQTLVPHFRAGEFQAGIQARVDAIEAVLRSNRARPSRRVIVEAP